jgi:hypothetical protein
MCNQNNKKHTIDPTYIEPFFVGLLEGDGSISVNPSGSRYIVICFVIRLKYNEHNKSMLESIQRHIGGQKIREVRVKGGNNQIVWAASAKKDVANILTILEKYPLLSSRKICQLEFLKRCLENPSVEYLLQTRGSRYDNQQQIIQQYNNNFILPTYFASWLSGFIEAEGSFKSPNNCLRIGVNHDWYILNAIKQYFNSHHTISLRKSGSKDTQQKMHRFIIAISSCPVLKYVIKHFEQYPLLGYKKVSYDDLVNKLKNSERARISTL